MSLAPRRRPGEYVIVAVDSLDGLRPAATVAEDERLTAVLTREEADGAGLDYGNPWAWITLDAATDPSDVGVTAAFSAALAEAGIACNVLAGLHHDHMLVPVGRADEAISLIQAL